MQNNIPKPELGNEQKFPIGFLIWKTNQNVKNPLTEVRVEVFDKNVQPIGEKLFYNLPNSSFLNIWIDRPRANKTTVIPLKNGITPYEKTKSLNSWSDNALGYMWCQNNDFQHAEQQTVIFSSVWGDGHGFYITENNLWQAAIIFTVRRLFVPTWLNDRDQFLQPTAPLSDEFKTDCLIWMLFNRCQRTASANNLDWNGKKWSIVNHFIPYTETEVNAPDRFESDFMVQYLATLRQAQGERDGGLSDEAVAVLDAGRLLWQAYFAETDVRGVRDELKLNRPDVGWYQIRNALKARNASGDYVAIDFKPFETAYKTLSEKLQPQVFELGFLRA